MSDTPRNWKRTLKWAGFYFLLFLSFLYLNTYRNGTPYRGAVMFLFIVCMGGAYLLWRSLDREEKHVEKAQDERDWLEDLKHDTLQLALEHDGVLTVTDVATDLEVSLTDAERVLTELEDGVRVASTVTEDGVIVYEFKEIIHRQARLKNAGRLGR